MLRPDRRAAVQVRAVFGLLGGGTADRHQRSPEGFEPSAGMLHRPRWTVNGL
jgi:hypothetical protein